MQLKFLIPDMHIPYHDKRAWNNVLSCIEDVQPDEVCILGDFLDVLAPARWSRASAAEYAAGMDNEAAAGQTALRELRSAYGGRVSWIYGNHDLRLRKYVSAHAPALVGIVPDIPELLEFEKHQVELKDPQPYMIAPGVGAIHGEKLASTQNAAGQSAYKERARHGISIVQGHTHRLGIGFDTTDRTRFWLECGWLGDIRKAGGYLSFPGVANWQMGFGYLYVDGSRVQPGIVPVDRQGRFWYNGVEYK